MEYCNSCKIELIKNSHPKFCFCDCHSRNKLKTKEYSSKSLKKDYSGRLVTIDRKNPKILFNRYLS